MEFPILVMTNSFHTIVQSVKKSSTLSGAKIGADFLYVFSSNTMRR